MKTALIPILALFLALSGCSGDLQTIAKAEDSITKAVKIVADTSTQLVSSDAMTTDEAAKVSAILTHVENADRRAIAATKAVASLDPATKATLSQIINPIIAEIQGAVTIGDVAQIKNQNAKLAITTALSALTTTLAIIQSKVGN